MLRPFSSFRAPAALLLAAIACGTTAVRANLIVYEGFTGYTSSGTRLDQYSPNANTVGLNTGENYYDGASSPRTANYTITTGLTFGSLQTSGGALAFITGTNVIGAKLSLSSAFTGTLWSSYLVRLGSQTNTTGNGAVLRISDITPSDSTNTQFSSWANSRSGTNNNLSVGYSQGATEGGATTNAAALDTGTTYIVINKFTRVGQTVDGSNPGLAQSWALTESQFAAFLAEGGDEAALGLVSVTATALHSTTANGTRNFSSSKALGIVTVGESGVYDELRYGSSLADVTPVPEPASAALLASLASASLFIARRHRA